MSHSPASAPRRPRVPPSLVAHYQQFAGRTIARVSFVTDSGAPCPVLDFTDGTFALVWCDPEQNGPGHLSLYSAHGTELCVDPATVPGA